jgi:ArsR family transcriptional regulator, arsenate/arsenite/antimonite-responsive transcriptional repressor
MAASEPIILEPKRQTGQSCCEPVAPRLSDQAAKAAADLLKALADPARLQILDILVQRSGLVCVCDFEGVVGLPDPQTGQRPKQPTISHHLRVLRDAGLVGYEKQGLWAYYFVRRERLAEIQTLLKMFS